MKLHPNSLTIPRTELEGFMGSQTLANECAAALMPVRNLPRCVLFDRSEVMAWYHAKVLPSRKRPEFVSPK